MSEQKLVVGKNATSDITDICEWYSYQQFGLEKRFLTELESFYSKMLKNPERYRFHLGSGEIRKVRLKMFPYHVFYSVLNQSIEIVGVIHVSRSEEYVRERLK